MDLKHKFNKAESKLNVKRMSTVEFCFFFPNCTSVGHINQILPIMIVGLI